MKRPAPRRRGGTLAAALLALAAALGAPGAGAAEREYATLVALGGSWPIASAEGLSTPVVVVDHEQDNPLGTGKLNLSLRTSTGEAALRYPLGAAWEAEARWRATVISQGDGPDRYVAGERRDREAFEGDGTAGVAALRLYPEGAWGAALEVERLQTRYRRVRDTSPAFDLPPDHAQEEARLRVTRRRLLGEEEASLELTGSAGRRFGWRAWALAPDAAARTYQRLELDWEQPLTWSGTAQGKLRVQALSGAALDYLSAFRIGGFGGVHALPGYYRNEFRARRAWIGEAEHTWAPAEDRRLTLFAAAAELR